FFILVVLIPRPLAICCNSGSSLVERDPRPLVVLRPAGLEASAGPAAVPFVAGAPAVAERSSATGGVCCWMSVTGYSPFEGVDALRSQMAQQRRNASDLIGQSG